MRDKTQIENALREIDILECKYFPFAETSVHLPEEGWYELCGAVETAVALSLEEAAANLQKYERIIASRRDAVVQRILETDRMKQVERVKKGLPIRVFERSNL